MVSSVGELQPVHFDRAPPASEICCRPGPKVSDVGHHAVGLAFLTVPLAKHQLRESGLNGAQLPCLRHSGLPSPVRIDRLLGHTISWNCYE